MPLPGSKVTSNLEKSPLYTSLVSQHWSAERLSQDSECEWVRCWFGILGLVEIPDGTSDSEVPSVLSSRIDHAHSVLDELPEEKLNFDELWNVTLLVKVPWGAEDLAEHSEAAAALSRTIANTAGSRKVIVWKGEGLLAHVGRLGTGGGSWRPTSGDPIRETLIARAKDDAEKDAINILLDGGRISDSKLDDLVRVFARDRRRPRDDR